jgi:hypothetical protein
MDAKRDEDDLANPGVTSPVEESHVETRAVLLPEEQAAGSDDPERQAQVILEDSLARTEEPNAAPTTHLERRRSEDTV